MSVVRMPLARSRDLIVEELGEELLIYDIEADRGHCLSRTASRVWQRCDGRTPADSMSAQLDVDADAIGRALEQLAACGLLESPPELSLDAVQSGGTTRREVATKFVKAGAVAAAAPLIVSVAAPTPAQAQTAAFCAQFNSDMGCGTCQQNDCCCCTPAGGAGKLCVPPTTEGVGICCAEFGEDTVFAAGCPTNSCPAAAEETESTEFQTQSQESAPTESAPTEPAPTEPAPTEPAPTEPAPTEPAPTTEAPATGGSAAPPTTETTTP
jgi:hypothetical protein